MARRRRALLGGSAALGAALVVLLAVFDAQRAGAVGACSQPGATSWVVGFAHNNWSNSANWSAGVPTAATHACIQNAPTGGFVSIGGPANVASLESTRTVTVASGDLRLNWAMDGSTVQSFNLTSGTVRGPGSLTITGSATWSGGTLGANPNPMTTTIASGATLDISGSTTRAVGPNSLLRIDGIANWTGTGEIDGFDGTGIEIGPGGKLDAKNDGTLLDANSTGPIAELRVLAGGTFTKSAGAGTTIVSMPLNNQGTVSASGGTVRLAAVGSHSGSLAASTGAALHVNANQTLAAGVDVGGQERFRSTRGARSRSPEPAPWTRRSSWRAAT